MIKNILKKIITVPRFFLRSFLSLFRNLLLQYVYLFSLGCGIIISIWIDWSVGWRIIVTTLCIWGLISMIQFIKRNRDLFEDS